MVELIVYSGLAIVSGGGIGRWIQHDGPIRLLAGLTAVVHRDETRRRDARRVLTATRYLRGHQPGSVRSSEVGSASEPLLSAPARRRGRPADGMVPSSQACDPQPEAACFVTPPQLK